MTRRTIWLALPIFLASTTLFAEDLFLQAARCGDAIRKNQVTMVDVREMSGDIDTVTAYLWKQIGPFSMIRGDEVALENSSSPSKALKEEKRSAAGLGCDVLIIADTARLTSMASAPGSGSKQSDETQMVSFYGCRWAGDIQPDCPIPDEVLDEFERQQMNKAD